MRPCGTAANQLCHRAQSRLQAAGKIELRTENAAAVRHVGLLHNADAWPFVLLMHIFATFTDDVELFKPRKGHRI